MLFEGSSNKILKGPASAVRKLAVCSFAGAALTMGVVLADVTTRDEWPLGLAGGAALGLIAGSVLVLRDVLRNRSRRWRAKCEERAQQLLCTGEARGPAEALRSAEARVAEETNGCIAWIGMILGGIALLSGAIMLVIKIVEAAKRVL